jgi:hypothetical protein
MINIFDLAGYTPDIFEYTPINIIDLIDNILPDILKIVWNNPIFYEQLET